VAKPLVEKSFSLAIIRSSSSKGQPILENETGKQNT
jgi:hypothetical protein